MTVRGRAKRQGMELIQDREYSMSKMRVASGTKKRRYQGWHRGSTHCEACHLSILASLADRP